MRFPDLLVFFPLGTRNEEFTMAKILKFPVHRCLSPLRIASGAAHKVSVRISDDRRPEQARWYVQQIIQNAASFRALSGFTDESVRRNERHRFVIRKTSPLRRFLREIEPLIRDDRVVVFVDGARVRPFIRKVA